MADHTHDHGYLDNELIKDRWLKKRTFVRELVGVYSEIYKDLLEQPRVYKNEDIKWKGGPRLFGKKTINPQSSQITQMIESHIDVFAPGAAGQKHGHMNSAVFYILDGKGYDVHDGVRYDWEAGDVCIVGNCCVHQHFNADPNKSARVMVVKAKPLFLFAHLIYQKIVEWPSTEPVPGYEDFKPED